MSLEALQKLRAQNVETLMMELAQITQTLTRSEEHCRVLEAHIQSDIVTYQEQAQRGMTVETLVEWQGRINAQQAALHRTRHEVEHVAMAWQQTKARLVEANQDCKLLDRIVDQRRSAQRTEAAHREQQATDEAAVRSHFTERTSGI